MTFQSQQVPTRSTSGCQFENSIYQKTRQVSEVFGGVNLRRIRCLCLGTINKNVRISCGDQVKHYFGEILLDVKPQC